MQGVTQIDATKVQITARQLNKDGTLSAPSSLPAVLHLESDGFYGVEGVASTAGTVGQLGYAPQWKASEDLTYQLPETACFVSANVRNLFQTENGAEQGRWRVYKGTKEVGSGKFVAAAGANTMTLGIQGSEPFDRIVFDGLDYLDMAKDSSKGADSSDYFVRITSYNTGVRTNIWFFFPGFNLGGDDVRGVSWVASPSLLAWSGELGRNG